MKKQTQENQSTFVQVMSALAIGTICFVILASLATWLPGLLATILGIR